MNFDFSETTTQYLTKLNQFMDEHIYPNEATYMEQMQQFGQNRWQIPPIINTLKDKAKAQGLWNLFLPDSEYGQGLSNLDYAPLAEVMGCVDWAPEIFNCSAPDTGNMEVLVQYGSDIQKEKYLAPLLSGTCRSCFAMTEPDIASSDASNIASSIENKGDHYLVNGHKWWSSGAMDPRCDFFIFMGKTDPSADKYHQQSMILIDKASKGVEVKRFLSVFGYDDAPHGHAEVEFNNVKVPIENLLLGEGRGFEIAQGRLGPGRIHHCMRIIGAAEYALELMCKRLLSRKAFGKLIAEHSVWEERIAEARMSIEMTRLLVFKAAYLMDTKGNKAARKEIAMIKVAAPIHALKVLDDAIQAYGGIGISDDPGLALLYAHIRALRLADGPDEVHRRSIAKLELKRYK